MLIGRNPIRIIDIRMTACICIGIIIDDNVMTTTIYASIAWIITNSILRINNRIDRFQVDREYESSSILSPIILRSPRLRNVATKDIVVGVLDEGNSSSLVTALAMQLSCSKSMLSASVEQWCIGSSCFDQIGKEIYVFFHVLKNFRFQYFPPLLTEVLFILDKFFKYCKSFFIKKFLWNFLNIFFVFFFNLLYVTLQLYNFLWLLLQ